MRPLLLASVFTLTLIFTVGLAAQPYDLHAPYGMHGPTFSHRRNDPGVWDYAQTVFDAFRQLGMDYARMDAWWGLVEPEPGFYDWEYWDRVMQHYEENGIHLMVILCYGAAWENAAGPVTDETREAFGEYVFQMVSRYSHIVKEWEIWNEPNILPFWAPNPDVADYAALLRVAYERAKEADPNCVILGGAMAGPDLDFVRGIFEHGAGGSFDVLSYHNYGNRPTRQGAISEHDGLRQILDEWGRDDAPIWMSEHGIFTGPGGVTEREQARDIVRLAMWRWAEGVERSVYLSLRDWHADEETTAGARDFWGLLTAEGEPKESFYAMRTMLSAIRDRDYTGELHLGPGIEAFLWGGSNDNAVVIWSDEPREIALDAGVTHLVTESLLGDCELLTSDSRVFDLSLSDEPLWLHGVGENLVVQAGIETEVLSVARGDEAVGILSVRNPTARTVQIDFTPQAPGGIEVPGLPTLIVMPDQTADMTFRVSAGDEAPVGELDIPLEVSLTGPALPMGPIVHHMALAVEEPFSVALLRSTSLDEDGHFPLQFEITNHTGEMIRVESEIRAGDVTLESPDLDVLDSGTMSLPLDLAAITPGDLAQVSAEFTAVGHTVEVGNSLRIFPVPRRSHEVTIDGDLSEWTGAPTLDPSQFTEVDFNPNLNEGLDDMAISAWLGWDEEGLWLALEVRDDVLDLPPNHMIWDFDGLQIALDPRNDAVPDEGFNYDDMEIEIGLRRDGDIELFPGRYPPGRIEEVVADESEVAIVADEEEGVLRYELHFPAAVLDPMPLEAGAVVGFNLIHNDADEGGREGWHELAPGIGWGKDPSAYPAIVLMP